MQSLCYLDLPQLCLGTLYHPSVTRGDPLTAPKRPETRPKPTDFPLSTSDVSKGDSNLTRYAPNFSDMLFMVIEISSPRGFRDFILGAEKNSKNCPKNGHFAHSDFYSFFANISGSNQKFRNRLGDALFIRQGHHSKPFEGMS